MSITDCLIPILQKRFADRGLHVGNPPDPIAVFPCVVPEVGDVFIYDDTDEAMVEIRNITHYHINPYNEDLTPSQRDTWIRNQIVEDLENLFADRILLWSVDKGRQGGGWHSSFQGNIPDDILIDAQVFVWTRQVR